MYYYYYVGNDVSTFDLLLTEAMCNIINSGNLNDCLGCILGNMLNRYKNGYCGDIPLVTSCDLRDPSLTIKPKEYEDLEYDKSNIPFSVMGQDLYN